MKTAPLKGSFMVISVVGFLVSYFAIFKYGDAKDIYFMRSIGFAFMIAFVIMIVSSLISMTKAPIADYAPAGKRRK